MFTILQSPIVNAVDAMPGRVIIFGALAQIGRHQIMKLRNVSITGCSRLAGCERVVKRDRVSFPFTKPLITAGTGRQGLLSLYPVGAACAQ